MKKNKLLKTFLLLTAMLVGSATNLWGQTLKFSATPLQTFSTDDQVLGAGDTELTSEYATISGGKFYFSNGETDSKKFISKQSNVYAFASVGGKQGFKVVLGEALNAGDVISVEVLTNGSGSSNGRGIWVTTATSRPSSAPTCALVGESSTGKEYVNVTYKVVTDDGLCGETTFYIWRATSNSTYFNNFNVTSSAASTDPVITASDASITATESGVAVTKDIAVTGENLTGSTLTATLNPTVDGLSVSLASNTIIDGAISTTATLSYTATENASRTTTLTLSDGTTSKDVTVTYKAEVKEWVLQSVSETTTWDIAEDITGSKQFTGEDKNKEFVYISIPDLTFAPSFKAETLAFKGEYPFRGSSNKYAQNGVLRFNTTVPGTVAITFQSTSSNKTGRFVQVNGARVSSEATGSWKTESFNVAKGDVIISGTEALRFQKIVFTPTTTASVSATIASSGYTTFCSPYDLSFESVSNLEAAYVVTTSTASTATLKKVTAVPGGTGVILKGTTPGAVTIPVAEYTGEAISNILVGTLNATHVETETVYVVSGGEFKKFAGTEIPAGKAYLPASAIDGVNAPSLSFDFGGETTFINSLTPALSQEEGVYYDLSGRRVAQPTKGLYIVNGKKVLVP